MPSWTAQEEALLRDNIHLGAEECCRIINKATGASRSPQAVARHASRQGLTRVAYLICPRCGNKVSRLNKQSKLCTPCNQQELLEKVRAENMALKEEISRNSDGYTYAEREYHRIRRENLRIRGRLGVETHV